MGLAPEVMEDKWFVYFEEPHLSCIAVGRGCLSNLHQPSGCGAEDFGLVPIAALEQLREPARKDRAPPAGHRRMFRARCTGEDFCPVLIVWSGRASQRR